MDPELNRHMLTSEGRGFVPGYPQSMLDILGRNNIAAVHGPLHRAMRGAMLSLVRPAMIRDTLLPKIDDFMRSHLAGWAGCLVDIQERTKEVSPVDRLISCLISQQHHLKRSSFPSSSLQCQFGSLFDAACAAVAASRLKNDLHGCI